MVSAIPCSPAWCAGDSISSSSSLGAISGQTSTSPGWSRRVGVCVSSLFIKGKPGPRLRLRANTASTACRISGSERKECVSGISMHRQRGGILDARGKIAVHARQRARIGALKTINRLLLIADDEQRARHVFSAKTCEKFLRQRVDDLPLLGAGILRLVDENMIDAAVELEQHPWRDARLLQQVAGGAG